MNEFSPAPADVARLDPPTPGRHEPGLDEITAADVAAVTPDQLLAAAQELSASASAPVREQPGLRAALLRLANALEPEPMPAPVEDLWAELLEPVALAQAWEDPARVEWVKSKAQELLAAIAAAPLGWESDAVRAARTGVEQALVAAEATPAASAPAQPAAGPATLIARVGDILERHGVARSTPDLANAIALEAMLEAAFVTAERMAQLEGARDQARAEAEALRSELESARFDLASLPEQITYAQKLEREHWQNALSAREHALQGEIGDLRQQRDEFEAQRRELSQSLANTAEELARAKAQAEGAYAEAGRARRRADALQTSALQFARELENAAAVLRGVLWKSRRIRIALAGADRLRAAAADLRASANLPSTAEART